MKKIIVLLFFVSALLSGQTSLKKAEKFYNRYSYSKVIEKLENKKELSTRARRELAESYRMMSDYSKAEMQYELLSRDEAHSANDILSYAQVLKINGKYDAAEKQMQTYSHLKQEENRVKLYKNNPNYLEELLVDKGQFKIKYLEMNSKEQDFGLVYFKDKAVFTSSRSQIGLSQRTWNGNQLAFLDLYVTDIDSSTGELSNIKRASTINKKYHEGPASYNAEGTQLVFTRNNYSANSSDGVTKLELYESDFVDNKWTAPRAFEFNDKEYSLEHPALNAAGDELFFASDMPGGYGGLDLYYTRKNETGRWTEPENLGSKINTEGNETFPFIHESGLLFFASDGLPGLGGLDIFVCEVHDKQPRNPINLGAPVNSNRDDFSLTLDKAQQRGYFSSNREGGRGSDDLYAFEVLRPFLFGKVIQGIAKDKNGRALENVIIALYNENSEIVGSAVTDSTGSYSFKVEDQKNYELQGAKQNYSAGSNTATTKGSEAVVHADVVLEKTAAYSLLALVNDAKTGLPLEGVALKLTDKNGKIQTYTTGENGTYQEALANAKVGDLIQYKIELSKPGYLSKTLDFKKQLEKPGEIKVHENLNLSLGKIEIGTDIGKLINIKPIYFDVNKFNIRPDAATELQKIVKVMNDYPAMVIELGSHTDCRAPLAYNMNLSDKRAKASAAYIISKGIAASRIYGKGYGESKLKNGCACEGPVKSTCSDAEHQENRRTEFVIVKLLD